ncbi:MAG: glycosyltransferase family 4 protein, partial [Planctomycetota bacterium]
MKIAYLLEFSTLLGGERSWLAMLPHLQGVEPLAVARPSGPLADQLKDRGIRHAAFDWPRGEPEDRAQQLIPLLKAEGCDLIHANSLTTSLCVSVAAEALGCPGVGHCRDIMSLSRARVGRLKKLGRIVAVSRAAAEGLTRQGVPEELVTVVRNGVDAEGVFNPASVADGLHA